VWASVLVGIACLFWIARRKKKGFQTILVGAGLIIVPLAIFFAIPGKGNSVLESVTGSAGQAISTEEGTMVGRVAHWQELLTKWGASKNPATYLIGEPYGSAFNPVDVNTGVDGIVTFDMVPHNHYVHILYRGGLIGLFATLFIFYSLWKSSLRGLKSADKQWAPLFVTIFAALFAFYIPYWATYSHAILIGIAINYFGLTRKHRISHIPVAYSQPYFRPGNF
jgi:O-antigen ligase